MYINKKMGKYIYIRLNDGILCSSEKSKLVHDMPYSMMTFI